MLQGRKEAEMNTEEMKRAWFGAIREVADKTGKGLKEKAVLSPVQAVKLDILLRQYMCDGLTDSIRASENITAEKAEELQKDVCSELIEDAIAGIWSEIENIETAMFLYECTKGARPESLFSARLREVLLKDDIEEEMQAVTAEMNREMQHFIDQRRKRWQTTETSNEDDPPPWLDEFEYSAWVMAHRKTTDKR